MQDKLIPILILLPILAVVILACIHEFRRYKSEGKANYGLVYDESTGTTYLSGIGEDEEAYDPEDFDPSSYDDLKAKAEDDLKAKDEDETDDAKT